MARLFESDWKSVRKCAFEMVFVVIRGFECGDRNGEKVKNQRVWGLNLRIKGTSW